MTLAKREAALRAEAYAQIIAATVRLDGAVPHSAFKLALYNRPKAALRAIERAEARLRLAKAALRAWAR